MLEDGIKERLGGDDAVRGMVDTRVRPLVGAQLDARPFILFSKTAAQHTGTYQGKSEFQKANVEVAIYADTYLECVQLSEHTRRLLDSVAVNLTNCQIRPSLLDDETDVEQVMQPGTETAVFVRTQSYRVLYRDV